MCSKKLWYPKFRIEQSARKFVWKKKKKKKRERERDLGQIWWYLLASNSSKSRTNSPIDEVAKRFRTDLVIFFDLTREREREVEASQRSFGLLKGPRVLGCKR